jgi:hypothetical protein
MIDYSEREGVKAENKCYLERPDYVAGNAIS